MILIWGYDHDSILTKQKQAIRILHSKHFLAHTDPLFKQSRILKISDMHTLAQLKFSYKLIHNDLPDYFKVKMPFQTNDDTHSYQT